MTENQNGILDVKFEKIYKELEKNIKGITGVIESGLFLGYNIEVIGGCEWKKYFSQHIH